MQLYPPPLPREIAPILKPTTLAIDDRDTETVRVHSQVLVTQVICYHSLYMSGYNSRYPNLRQILVENITYQGV